MSITLYELGEQWAKACDEITIDEETGEVHGFEALELIDAQYDEKAVNAALYAKGLAAEIAAIKAEEDALNRRRKAAQAKLDRLKRYIGICMDTVHKDKIEDARVRLSFRNSKRVQILDEASLPARLLRIKSEPDRAAIAQELKHGAEIPGAVLADNRTLQIK